MAAEQVTSAPSNCGSRPLTGRDCRVICFPATMTSTPQSCFAGWRPQRGHAGYWCERSCSLLTASRMCQGTRGYRHLTGDSSRISFVAHRDEQLVYLAVHNHGGTDTVSFSATDLDSHERGYPTLLSLTGLPVGALGPRRPRRCRRYLATRRHVGHSPGRSWRAVTPAVLTPVPAPGCGRTSAPAITANHSSLVPADSAILGQAKVGIIGAGGVGMLLVQTLARLGVGHLVVIDPDRVDPTNLPRLPEATRHRRDDMAQQGRHAATSSAKLGRRLARHKVNVARRIARRANDAVTMTAVVGDVADDKTAKLLTDCDFHLPCSRHDAGHAMLSTRLHISFSSRHCKSAPKW